MHIFSGLKIIDCTKVYSGPLATRMFADYGAEVIKVENPKSPDDSRLFPPLAGSSSGYFETLNRNKKCISMDLKNEEGLKAFYELIKTADVFVENMTPSVKKKLHIDYETVKAINPRIIYASLSGVGQNEDRKYYDILGQAESGLMSLTGTPETPMKIGPAVVDAYSGMTLAFAIASALFYRERTGKGQYLDVTMIGSSMNLLENNLSEYAHTHKDPVRAGNVDNAIAPFGIYKTKNSFIALALGNDLLWKQFREVILSNVSFDPTLFETNALRLANQSILTNTIETAFSNFDTNTLIELLRENKIPCAKVATIREVALNEDYQKQEILFKYSHPELGECVVPGRAIHFSEDTERIVNPAKKVGEDNKNYGL